MNNLRCKPGDLAMVIGGRDPLCPPPLGSVVRVTQLSHVFPDAWEMEDEIIDPRDGYRVVILDCQLRPLRDPGDAAQDETLLWLPVPSRKAETSS